MGRSSGECRTMAVAPDRGIVGFVDIFRHLVGGVRGDNHVVGCRLQSSGAIALVLTDELSTPEIVVIDEARAMGICGEPEAFVESATASVHGLRADWLPWLSERQVMANGCPALAFVGLAIWVMTRSATGRTVNTATALVAAPPGVGDDDEMISD